MEIRFERRLRWGKGRVSGENRSRKNQEKKERKEIFSCNEERDLNRVKHWASSLLLKNKYMNNSYQHIINHQINISLKKRD